MYPIASYALRDIAEIAALGAFLVMIAFIARALGAGSGKRRASSTGATLPALDAPAAACDNPVMDSSVIKAVGFVHLHVHSAYSLREGALTIETLAKLAQGGVQPIIGAQTTVDFADAAPAFWRGVERDNARAPIVLLAQNETGYGHLMRLVSALWLDPKDGDEAHLPFAALRESEGLIALTGGPAGPIDRALRGGLGDLAESRLKRLIEVFDSRLYVEIQRHGLQAERAIEPALITLADRLCLP